MKNSKETPDKIDVAKAMILEHTLMSGVIVQDHAKGTTPVKKHPKVGKNVDLSLFED